MFAATWALMGLGERVEAGDRAFEEVAFEEHLLAVGEVGGPLVSNVSATDAGVLPGR